jgi:hypothetical protein
MFDDNLRLERALTVARNVEWQRAEIALECLGAMAIAGVGFS